MKLPALVLTSFSRRLQELQKTVGYLAPAYLAALFTVLALLSFGIIKGVPLADLSRDPTAVLKGPFYTGALSSLGVALWASGAAICYFAAASGSPEALSPRRRRFLLESGALTTLLLLDDLFLIHETVAPRVLGIPETLVYAAYGALMLQHLIRFSGEIARSEWSILFLSLGWFALSLFMDFVPDGFQLKFFLEDSLKFLGIVTWVAYFWSVGSRRDLPAEEGRTLSR